MEMWEYQHFTKDSLVDLMKRMNELSSDGWELVQVLSKGTQGGLFGGGVAYWAAIVKRRKVSSA
ncbi:MAG: hypothetical protein ACYCRD_04730 [Leptospirillum sp.]